MQRADARRDRHATTSTTARASATRRPRSRCASRSGSPARPARSTTSSAPSALLIIGANPTAGPPGRRRADQAGGAARHCSSSRSTRAGSSSPTTASLHLRAAARARTPRSCSASRTSLIRDGLVDQRVHRRAHRGLRRARGAARRLHARGGRGDHRRPRRRPRARPRTSTARPSDASISWGLGVTEHKYGSEVVQLICNLALMTGKIGRPGSALLPLRGQNNVQGSSDMGALPDTYTALPLGRRRGGRAQRSRQRWGVPITRERGLKIPEMFDAAVAGDAEGDVHLRRGRRPDRPRTPTHVVARARVARVPRLPGHLRDRDDEVRRRDPARLRRSSRRRGTFTNAERRIQLVERGDRPARRGARPTSRSCTLVSRALGHEMGYDGPEDVMARDRRADARTSPASPTSASAAAACSGRSTPTAPTRRSSTSDEFDLPGGRAHFAALPVQGAGRRGRRGVPADPRHRAAGSSTTTPAR